MLSRIRIVLVNTSHPGNIGAVARAMKNMCLDDLVLVDPVRYPEEADVAFSRASGAHDLLTASRKVETLAEDGRWNQPNDICQAPSGDIYFSDPGGSNAENPVGSVYRFDITTAKLSAL